MQNSTSQTPVQSKMGKHWRKDGQDYIADLGTLKKAIVIRLFVNSLISSDRYYRIALASMLPFTEEQYDKRFDEDKPHEAIAFAEGIVKAWMESLFVIEDNRPLQNSLGAPSLS